jgi:hypothetical protein
MADGHEIADGCACDSTSPGVRHWMVLDRCFVLSGVNASEGGRLRDVFAIPGRANGQRIAERVPSDLRRDGKLSLWR